MKEGRHREGSSVSREDSGGLERKNYEGIAKKSRTA